MKKKMFIIPLAITAFALTSCGEKEISKEEATQIVKKANEAELPTYTTITASLELAKYKFEGKGPTMEAQVAELKSGMDALFKETGFEDPKPGAKISQKIEVGEFTASRVVSIDGIFGSLEIDASVSNSVVKYFAVGNGVKASYSLSSENKTELNGMASSSSASTSAYVVLNDYALPVEQYFESTASQSITISGETNSLYMEFAIRTSVTLE